jgi:hypothetical protein
MSDETRTLLDQPIVATPEEIRSARLTIVEFCESHEMARGKFSEPVEETLAGLLHMLTGPAPDPETKTQLAKRRKAARQEGVKVEEYERIPIVGPFDGVRD